MRLKFPSTVTDHGRLQNVAAHDHHPQGTSYTIAINSQALAGLTAFEHRFALGRTGHKTMRVILRGPDAVNIQGHAGVFALGSDVSGECSGVSIRPYSGSYPTSYMGGYSRVHGDSYLTHNMFGGSIRLRDAYIDGSDAVLEFYNPAASAGTLMVWGSVAVK